MSGSTPWPRACARSCRPCSTAYDVGGLVYGEASYWHMSLTGEPAKKGLGGPAGSALVRSLLAHGVQLIAAGGLLERCAH